jgi:hypothetical protein
MLESVMAIPAQLACELFGCFDLLRRLYADPADRFGRVSFYPSC